MEHQTSQVSRSELRPHIYTVPLLSQDASHTTVEAERLPSPGTVCSRQLLRLQ